MSTWTTLIIATFATLTLLTGCLPQPPEPAPDPVTAQLKWVHQAQFAGMYIADSEGLYADEGLTVTLRSGGDDVPPDQIIAGLVAGESDFAVIGGDLLLQARARGEPLVAVAVLFQRNPYVYVSLESSGIRSPQDLLGKRLMMPEDAAMLHQTLFSKLGLDPESVELVPYLRDVTPLMTHVIDAQLVYRTGLGLAFDEMDAGLTWMYLEDYGVHVYADTLVTTETMIRDHPDLVTRFLRATLKGWRYAIENPDAAVDATLARDPELDQDLQKRMMTTQIPFVHTGDVPIGWMTREAWQSVEAIVLAQQPLDIDAAFTMQFLNDVYDAGN